MKVTTVLIFCIGITIISLEDVHGAITEGPENFAAVNGSTRARFNCTTNLGNPQALNWQRNGSFISIACSQPADTDYEIETVGTAQCNLIIRRVGMQHAGIYQCAESFGNPKSAYFTVLGSDPICSSNFTEDKIIDGENAALSCEVTFRGDSNQIPYLRWIDNGYGINTTTNNFVKSTFVVPFPTKTNPFIPFYFCVLEFHVPRTASIDVANNSASYSSNCSSYFTAEYQWCPVDVTITSTSASYICYVYGESLICNASANPVAIYDWYENNDGTGLVATNTSKLQIYELKNYTCVARNTIRSSSCSSNSTMYKTCINGTATTAIIGAKTTIGIMSTTSYAENSTINVPTILPTTQRPGPLPIVLGVVIPIILISIVAVVIVIWWKRKKRDNTKPTQPLIHGSETQNNQQFGTIFLPEYARVNKSANSNNQQDIHVRDGNQMIYGQLNIADTRRRKPIQSLIEDRSFPYATIVRA